MKKYMFILALALSLFSSSVTLHSNSYKNFKVSVYVMAHDVSRMKNQHWLDSTWSIISSQADIDKVYLETYRDLFTVDEAALKNAIKFFQKKGVETAGGITFTGAGKMNYESLSYANAEQRAKAKAISELTAKYFDEIILDDFFFVNMKTDEEIEAKGDMSWTEYRLKEMEEAGKNLVLDPAKKVNPNVKVIIKYPNWYDDFQGLGFDLEVGPYLFDGIWTGTETRDPASEQHLQNYLSYNIIRYFDNLRPGYNGGGWVDAGGIEMGMDRYAEQLHLTMLAKAPEIILFEYSSMSGFKLRPEYRTSWQDESGISWHYDEMTAPYKNSKGKTVQPTTLARVAGLVLKQTDELMGKLGNPVGIKSYKPFHSADDAFLQNYLGMIGLPMDMRPAFPEGQKVVLLTAQAADDEAIVDKIKAQLKSGGDVVITTGLLQAIPEKLSEIAELSCRNSKALVYDFGSFGKSGREIQIPQVRYYTNDTWPIIDGGRPLTGGVSGYPVLLRAPYSNGNMYIVTIPDDFGNLYDYPAGVLNEIRRIMSGDMNVYIEGPSKVALFAYDNNTVVVENFNDTPVEIKLVTSKEISSMSSLLDDSALQADPEAPRSQWMRRGSDPKNRFTLVIPAHSYRAYKY